MLSADNFRFLNETHSLSSPQDWNNPGWEKLWLYNLHYFDDLNAEKAEQRQDGHQSLVTRWINENPAPSGNGWEPYPLSLRIINWIKWFQQVTPETQWLDSLALQVRVLMQRLEHHLLGNHLFANAKALVYAGLYFEGKEAEDWLATGLGLLQREVPEQVLDDGGNFELTPMYHSIMLMDMLDLINMAQAVPHSRLNPFLPDWRKRAGQMLNWLSALCHPDGEISFFNDAAMGIAPTPTALMDYACRLGMSVADGLSSSPSSSSTQQQSLKLTNFEDSGYVRLESQQAVALLDVARVGPDYIPGHAHADSLSFELSLFGHRVFVNSGTSCYGLGDERLRQRGTAAHNTVLINNENSSEVWSGFRVARRAYPSEAVVDLKPDAYSISCSHTGYRWLKGKPRHHRQWELTPERFVIKDRVSGQYQTAEARFHLHPDVGCSVECEKEEGVVMLIVPGGHSVRVEISGQFHLEKSTWHPEFGLSVPSQCLVVTFDNHACEVSLSF